MKKPSLIKRIFNPFSISYIDLVDLAENNRARLVVVCPLVFLFGLSTLILTLFLYHENIQKELSKICYYGFYTISGLCSFIYSIKIKNCPKEKAVFLKNLPLYLLYYETLLAVLYVSLYVNQIFNGFVILCLVFCIMMNLFSVSPLLFLIGQLMILPFLSPAIYTQYHISGLLNSYLLTVVFFFMVLYKRSSEKKIITFANKQKNSLTAKTFGNFTLIYDNKVVKFSRTKSNELIGYLIYKNGSSVNTKELISVLWGDRADSARYGNNFRNLVVDIKHTLNDLEIQEFFITEYNNFRINPKVVKCDYYDFLAGDKEAAKNFTGEFMSQYSWAEDATAFLEMKALKK